MNNLIEHDTARPSRSNFYTLAGVFLILVGMIILADQRLHTGWLIYTIPLLAGLALIWRGIRLASAGLLISGGLTAGSGAGLLAALGPAWQTSLHHRITLLVAFIALGWVLSFWLTGWFGRRWLAWILIPAGISGATAAWFWLNPIRPAEYILIIPAAVGLSLLLCGILQRLFGLIVPGCILITSGPGVYYAWGQVGQPNGLVQTATMLVVMALGWGLITVFSRVLTSSFVWWPLIPGGLLAMVGWGLYIGGDPNNALKFIGNTGSIGLIVFGIYLLMWRNEIRRK